MAATEALGTVVGRDLPGLFDPTADDVKLSIGKLASPNNFSVLVRDFFSRLTQRHLDYYLSRELANHVGPQGRFNSIAEHTEFNAALDRHCREASANHQGIRRRLVFQEKLRKRADAYRSREVRSRRLQENPERASQEEGTPMAERLILCGPKESLNTKATDFLRLSLSDADGNVHLANARHQPPHGGRCS